MAMNKKNGRKLSWELSALLLIGILSKTNDDDHLTGTIKIPRMESLRGLTKSFNAGKATNIGA